MAAINQGAGRQGSRGFWSLIATQFQGAFSDNIFKLLVLSLLFGMEGLAQQQRNTYQTVINLLFTLPFVLFSLTGGFLADRFSKRTVTIGTKAMEIGVMMLAAVALYRMDLYFIFAVIFLMSTQSALFGPSKYGLLPELLPQKRLSWGNGVLEMGTFLAIILGMAVGPALSQWLEGQQAWSGAVLVGLAVVGLFTSLGIARVPARDPGRKFPVNPFGEFFGQVGYVRQDRVLWLSVVGFSVFWALGILLTNYILLYGSDVLGLTQVRTGALLVASALGIGVGSLAAGYLSGNKIEYGLIPLGAVGITVFSVLLSMPLLSFSQVAGLLLALGFASGFFIVPLNAIVQHRPDDERKGGVLGAANLLAAIGMLLAMGLYYLMAVQWRLTPQQMFFVTGVATLAGTAWAVLLLPRALLRLLLWFLTHTLYRIRVEGRDNIPEKGGALFVSNHLSFVDVALLMASTDRSIRFLMYKGFYELPWIKPIARVMGAIPISSQQRPREMLRSLRTAAEVIQNGGVVCIFAEGQITRLGQLLPFRRGFEKIMKSVDAPIVPVSLAGVWGSIFSFERGRALWKLPREIPYPVTVGYGRPLPHTASAYEVRAAIQELQTDAFRHRRGRMQPLHRGFVRTARRHRFRFAMADLRVPRLRFGAALTRTIFLARRLRKVWAGQKMAGILLPPSVPGALVNLAALLLGKVPVNLNYTASDSVLASCAQQCEIETVVTSKAFLEKVKLQVPGKTVFLEDLAANPKLTEKLTALAFSWLFPVALLEKALGQKEKPRLDDLATVIFSSGSTGDPKGVMLTHYNVGSNVEQINQIFALDRHDKILGILPFFHSFGFTATLAFPAVAGVGAVYHANPLEPRTVGELVRAHRATFLMTTPTFLQSYIRRVEPEDFGSLEFVLAGAEKLPERVAQAFEDRFGLRPLEGYGCTECSPVVAVNTRDFRSAGFRQVGAKRGRIGHPLPGMSVRIVDPETREPLPVGKAGLMLVSGPNIMKGYLGKPEKTAEVLQDGWYETGDIAALDEDGFLTITDRLSRFSKIGGEMVPHIKVEEGLHDLADATEQVFVVTGVPDARKGERLVVLHTLPEEQLKACLEKLPQLDLPNLWMPRADQFFHIEALPLLGTGKLDLRKIGTMALELASQA